ncbi:MAG: SpvB/TcaC N-terminal domain-containing protein [Nannocystales bacterium]
MPRRFGQNLTADDADNGSGPQSRAPSDSRSESRGPFGSPLPGLGESPSQAGKPKQPDAQTGFVGNSGFGGGVSAGHGAADLSQDPGQDSLAPSLELPKGGGALRGIGETFDINAFTGSGSLQIPIVSSPSRGGAGPQLGLSYSSGAGQGVFGLGMQLSPPSITRRTDRGLPTYDDDAHRDTFVMSGAEHLVPQLDEGGAVGTRTETRDGADYLVHSYRPRVESGFSRIERWTPQGGASVAALWRVTSPGNVVSTFGESSEARIADPDDPRRVFTWLLERIEDDRGNITHYRYKAENAEGVDTTNPAERRRSHTNLPQRYLKRILYGNVEPFVADQFAFEVVFDYGEHGALPPADVEALDVVVTAEETLPWSARPDSFSSYRSRFDLRRYRRCQRVLAVHHFAELHAGAATVVASTDLHYDDDPVGSKLHTAVQRGYIRDTATPSGYTTQAGPPLRLTYQDRTFGTSLADAGGGHVLRAGVDVDAMQLVDLDADGLPGILHVVGGSWMYQKPLGEGRFAAPQPQPNLPSPGRGRGLQLLDLDGDGRRAATFNQGSVRGSSRRHDDGSWGRLVAFDQVPTTDLGGARTRSVDVTGDGLADLVVDLGDRLRIYPSRGRHGHAAALEVPKPGDEVDRPRTVYTSPQVAVLFADMSGDGLADLVVLENGSVRYWPNLGWGRFGPSVTMGGLRPFDDPASFRASRVRLADVDGSGTADLVLFDHQGATVWFNATGNRFVEETRVEGFPPVDDVTHAEVQDLTGTGTADLVWSSSWPSAKGQHLRYLSLFPDGKPYLLTEVDNGVGLRTRLRYAPSTRFSLADQAAGTPWKTRLAFPVQVLDQVERHDAITGFRWTSSYQYRHGYFDAVEREFRGFARVDQQDVEHFEAGEDSLDVPPAHTRTWFHTGAPQALEAMLDEFWAVPGTSPLVDPVVVAPSLPGAAMTSDEYLEALRALRGQAVRQEVYSLDGSEAQERPFTVSETQSAVRLEQPRRRDAAYKDSRAVVFVHPAQTRTWHLERVPDDPRLQQSLTLEVDAYGVATRSAALGYPRRNPEHVEQGQSAIVVTEVDVVHRDGDDDLRLGIPVEQRSSVLQGLSLDPDAPLSADALRTALDSAVALPFESEPDQAGLRSLTRRQALYWNDGLTTSLPLGAVGERTLLHSQQSVRFSNAHAQAVFGEVLDDETLADVLTEGRYIQDGPSWWSRSGHAIPDPAQFFLPTRFVTPFGHESTVSYDVARQHAVSTVDALGNTVLAEVDYRVLSPRRVTDPNGSTAHARFDALGQVVAYAIAGRDGEGDTLEDPTGTFVVDLWAFVRDGRPTSVHSRSRERHADPTTRWLEQWTHVDGMGHVAQAKAMAEPGLAPQRDAAGELVLDGSGGVVLALTAQRWVGNGRVIRNNKGLPVKQYEPFFSDRPDYEGEAVLVETGVTPVMHYDPMGRVVRSDLPDGTFARVEFTPWWSRSFDPGDTVLESSWHADRIGGGLGPEAQRAAELSAVYADTPDTTHLDHLGRAFLTIAHNRSIDSSSGETVETFPETRASLDIEGNTLAVVDARGNIAQENSHAPGGVVLRTVSVDAGGRWALGAADGTPLRTWNSRGIRSHARFDALRRPTHQYVREPGASTRLVARTVYGESLPTPEATYHRGQVYRVYDGAGVATQAAYDFAGNPVLQSRVLAVAYEDTVDWSALAELEDVSDLEAAAAPMLESEVFESAASFDALGRPRTQTTPDGTVVRLAYNEAALLEGVTANVRGSANETAFVSNIDYDVKARRSLIAYGNGTETTYAYDEVTQRLTRMQTTDSTRTFQDLTYTYDVVGNIVEIGDGAQEDVYFGGAVVTARQRYEYDALYRVTDAEGREHIGQHAAQPSEFGANPSAHPQDGTAMRAYAEAYVYDVVGNILEMQHAAAGGNWTRRYQYAGDGNRLQATSLPGDAAGQHSATYGYDAHGNMSSMPHLSAVSWNYSDQMRSADLGGGGTVYFVYDGAGQRVRKVSVNQAGTQSTERIYLGAYELYRERTNGAVQLERETLHIADDAGRMCDVETRTVESGSAVASPTTHHRYQYSNHLGSASLELTGSAEVISYEEYHPYGTSSYRAVNSSIDVSERTYRYTGKERDEETGLGYHGARYYACWLGRWTASDPIGLGDGVNRYAYVSGNPITLTDPSGNFAAPPPGAEGLAHAFEGLVTEFEFLVGGSMNPRNGELRLPRKLDGAFGGAISAATFRLAPIEESPTPLARAGQEAGASVIPVADDAMRLATGESVTGESVSRTDAAMGLALDLLGVGLLGLEMREARQLRRAAAGKPGAGASANEVLGGPLRDAGPQPPSKVRIADGDEILPSGERLRDVRNPEARLDDLDCTECSIAAERNLLGEPATSSVLPDGVTPSDFAVRLNRGDGIHVASEEELVDLLLAEGDGATAIVTATRKTEGGVENVGHAFAVRVENGGVTAYDPTLLLGEARKAGEEFLGDNSVYRLFFGEG